MFTAPPLISLRDGLLVIGGADVDSIRLIYVLPGSRRSRRSDDGRSAWLLEVDGEGVKRGVEVEKEPMREKKDPWTLPSPNQTHTKRRHSLILCHAAFQNSLSRNLSFCGLHAISPSPPLPSHILPLLLFYMTMKTRPPYLPVSSHGDIQNLLTRTSIQARELPKPIHAFMGRSCQRSMGTIPVLPSVWCVPHGLVLDIMNTPHGMFHAETAKPSLVLGPLNHEVVSNHHQGHAESRLSFYDL